MESEFLIELARLLEKYDAKLIAESGFGEFESTTVAVVFSEFTETLGAWVSAKYLKEKLQKEE